MSIIAIYVFWGAGDAVVFADSYRKHQAGVDHLLCVICNDGSVSPDKRAIFSGIPAVFIAGDNVGRDIGAFQQSALAECDLMVFFGSTAYLRGPGWLHRMSHTFKRLGDNLYGSMANRGDANSKVFPHIRTTGFWMSPKLFAAYPFAITEPEHRYPFEHGPDCLTSWILKLRRKAIVVGWHHENAWPDWNIRNGFHDGDQSEVIVGDRLSKPPYYHCA